MTGRHERRQTGERQPIGRAGAFNLLVGTTEIIPGTISRHLVNDTTITSRIREIAMSPRDRGAVAFEALGVIPVNETEWRTEAGLADYSRESHAEAVRLLLSSTGTNLEASRMFTSKLAEQVAQTPESAFLTTYPAESLRIGVVRALNNDESDPEAVAELFDAFSSRFRTEDVKYVFQSAVTSVRYSGGHDRVVKYSQFVTALESSETISDDMKSDIREVNEPYQRLMQQEVERARRDRLQTDAQALLREGFTDVSFRAYERLVAEIDTFDPATAEVMRIHGKSAAMAAEGVSPEIQRREQDALNEIIRGYIRSNRSGEEISRPVTDALRGYLRQRSERADTDAEYDALTVLASGLGIDTHFIESAQEGLHRRLARERLRREQLALLGIENTELPEAVAGIDVTLPSGYLEYEDDEENGVTAVDAMIADIRSYFVEDVDHSALAKGYDKGRESTGNSVSAFNLLGINAQFDETGRIFNSLTEELREWDAEGAEGTFVHSQARGGGSAYKYSGSKFEGNTIQITRDEQSHKYRLDIGAGGYGYNYRDPSYQLRDFAQGLGKGTEVQYSGEPTISLIAEPTRETLDQIILAYPDEFVPSLSNSNLLFYSPTMPVDIQGMLDYYANLAGVPTSEALGQLDAEEREAVNSSLRENRIKFLNRQSYDPVAEELSKTLVFTTSDGGQIVLSFEAHSLPPEPYAQLRENGIADVSFFASHSTREDELSLRMSLPQLKMRYMPPAGSTVAQTTERVHRAMAVRSLLYPRETTNSEYWKKTSGSTIQTNFTVSGGDSEEGEGILSRLEDIQRRLAAEADWREAEGGTVTDSSRDVA